MKINRQEIVSAIEKLTRTQKILVQFLILALISGISWYFYLNPVREEVSRLKQESIFLENDITRFTVHAARLPDLEGELEEREKELLLARTLLPEDAHALERLLASFERLGNEKGVRFLLFQPGTEQVHKYYASRNVQLRLQGGFHDLVSYFDELSRLDRLVSLQSLRLNAVSGQPVEKIVLTAEAALMVYRSLSQEELKDLEND